MTVSKVFVLAAAVATVGLSGCAPILIGGAAVTSATVITDRRTTGSIVDDEVLEKRVRYEIGEVIGHEKHHVVVTSYEGKVLLTGEVLTAADRQKAQDTAVKSVGVHSVINELAVMTPATVGAVLSRLDARDQGPQFDHRHQEDFAQPDEGRRPARHRLSDGHRDDR